MDTQTVQVEDLQLVALPSALNCADLFVRFTLAEWSLRGLLDQAVLVIRDMVTAAVANSDQRLPGFLVVRLRLAGSSLVIELHDDEYRAPVISDNLAAWNIGIEQGSGRGHVLWCELPLPNNTLAASVQLPRRERRRSPEAERLAAAGEPLGVDPVMLERVWRGLGGAPSHLAE